HRPLRRQVGQVQFEVNDLHAGGGDEVGRLVPELTFDTGFELAAAQVGDDGDAAARQVVGAEGVLKGGVFGKAGRIGGVVASGDVEVASGVANRTRQVAGDDGVGAHIGTGAARGATER